MYDWKTCRVCLSSESVEEEMQSIFKKNPSSSEDIALKIERCGGIKINRCTAIAKMICAQCIINLTVANQFWKKVQQSNEVLKTYELKTELETNTSPDEILGNYDEMLSGDTEAEEFFFYNDKTHENQNLISIEITDNLNKKKKKKKSNVEVLALHENDSKRKIEIPVSRETRTPVKKEIKTKEARDDIHICEICGNSFKSKSILNLHMRRHQNIRPFKCEICSKNFACHSEIARHIRVHTGAKPFSCQYCDRKFSDRSTNIKHERTHTNERPFVCDQCGRAFMYSNVLKNHKLTHTGEKNFQCEPCNKTFARQHQLQQHIGTLIHKQTLEKIVKLNK